MANGYFMAILALFVVYSLVHHKKTAFYGDNGVIDDTSNEPRKTNFLPKEQQNGIYDCFRDIEIEKCDPEEKYRQITGYCNNLENPLWGGAHTSYIRIVDAHYDDIYALRRSTSGRELPLARKLSITVLSAKKELSNNKTLILSTFAQMVTHDVAGAQAKNGSGLGCCEELDRGSEEYKVLCCQLDIPDDDPFFPKLGRECIELHRHYNTYNDGNCTKLKYPYPLLRMTSYLDLSFLYGYDEDTSKPGREYKGGRLVSNDTDDGPALPLSAEGCPAKVNIPAQPICFVTGDGRINQNPEVVIYTTIFLRSHNHIATELETLHPDWDDSKLFEEARRINIAAYQRVVYNEFLPSIIGKENCKKRGFLEETDGYSDQYDPEVNAQSIISFSTGVFRSFHTLNSGIVTLRNNEYEPISYYRSMDQFNNQSFLVTQPHMYTQIINGLVRDRAIDSIGKFAALDFWDFCFLAVVNGTHFSSDLFSIDISRGRDDGIPPYNAMRRYCGLSPLTSFDQLTDRTRIHVAKELEVLYDSIEDLDLLIGVYLETPVPNSIFGPTAHCLIEEAFSRYKKGDRFFYEFNNEPVSFTEEQLKSIKQVTFSSFICLAQNNSELQLQEDSFHQPSPTNPKKKCTEIPFLDLSSF